jgi:hypothetical protein
MRRREEQVVGDDREGGGSGKPGEEAERHRDGRHDGEPEQPDVDGLGQLGIPGGVRLVERVAVDAPVQRVR